MGWVIWPQIGLETLQFNHRWSGKQSAYGCIIYVGYHRTEEQTGTLTTTGEDPPSMNQSVDSTSCNTGWYWSCQWLYRCVARQYASLKEKSRTCNFLTISSICPSIHQSHPSVHPSVQTFIHSKLFRCLPFETVGKQQSKTNCFTITTCSVLILKASISVPRKAMLQFF